MKWKLAFIVFFLFLITWATLIKFSFFKTEVVRKWEDGNLSWNDFLGTPIPFSQWGATISSGITLERDSISNQYRAIAKQFGNRSWTQSNSMYVLNHEQYHFNLTEAFARKLDAKIRSTNYDTVELINDLALERTNLALMQAQYDKETNHSLIRDNQRRWEYYIDSMLIIYETNMGRYIDPQVNSHIFFPAPLSEYEVHPNMTYMKLEKYDMKFIYMSLNLLQVEQINSDSISNVFIVESANKKNEVSDTTIKVNNLAIDFSLRYVKKSKTFVEVSYTRNVGDITVLVQAVLPNYKLNKGFWQNYLSFAAPIIESVRLREEEYQKALTFNLSATFGN